MARIKNPQAKSKQFVPSDVQIRCQMTLSMNSKECNNDDSTIQNPNPELNPVCSTHIETQSKTTVPTQLGSIMDCSRSEDLNTDQVDTDQPDRAPRTNTSEDKTETDALSPSDHSNHSDDESDDDPKPFHSLDPEQVQTHVAAYITRLFLSISDLPL